VVLGACEALESSGNVVVSRGRLTALLGVKDLVVVHAENATLICPRDRAQDIKKIVQALGARGIYQDLL
jgi:mannose-1-phosphate guanylyltransferase